MRRSDWIHPLATVALGALVAVGAGCRAEPSAVSKSAQPAAEEEPAELPAEPPPGGEEAVVETQPEVDAASGLEVRFGLRAGSDGGVVDPVLSFAHGDRVCVGASLAGASGERLGLRWFDAAGEEQGSQTLALAGEPARGAVCLPGSERLGLGSYSVEFELSGETIGDAVFAVADSRELSRGGGA